MYCSESHHHAYLSLQAIGTVAWQREDLAWDGMAACIGEAGVQVKRGLSV